MLIKNGHVMDPKSGLDETLDILIRDGKLRASESTRKAGNTARSSTPGEKSWLPALWMCMYTSGIQVSRIKRTWRQARPARRPADTRR